MIGLAWVLGYLYKSVSIFHFRLDSSPPMVNADALDVYLEGLNGRFRYMEPPHQFNTVAV